MFYKIVYHKPGKIKIEVPLLKQVSFLKMNKIYNIIEHKYAHFGIKDVLVSPLTGRITITYDEGRINIIEYIQIISNDETISKLLS